MSLTDRMEVIDYDRVYIFLCQMMAQITDGYNTSFNALKVALKFAVI